MDLPAPSLSHRPLRGRARELAAVVGGLADPRTRLVVVSGPPGVGKSALAAAALSGVDRPLVGAGRFPPGNAFGVAPLTAAVEDALAAALEGLFDPEAALEPLAESLGDSAEAFTGLSAGPLGQLRRSPAEAAPNVGVGAAAERLGQALITVCAWLTSLRGPMVLLLDDWGRGGPEAARLVERLLQATPQLSVLATERPEETFVRPPAVRALHVRLAPLDPEGRAALVAGELDEDVAAATEVLDFLGPDPALPFELLDAITVLKASGALHPEADRWRFSRAGAAETLAGAVADRLAGRVAEAGPAPRSLAEALALFGDSADLADLAACADLSGEAAEDGLRQLEALGVVRRTASTVAFSHDQVLAAVMAGMNESGRIAAAGRLAEALRRLGARPAAYGRGAAMLDARLVAGLAAVDAAAWAPLFLRGAEQARSVGAARRASEWSAAALALARRGGAITAQVFREAVYAAVEQGDYVRAGALAEEMLAVSDGPRARAEADEMRALVRRAAGDLEGALTVAREALARGGIHLPARARPWQVATTAMRVLATNPERAGRRTRVPPEALEVQAPLMRILGAGGALLYEKEPMRAVLFAIRGIPPKLVAGTAAGAGAYSVLCAAFGAFRKAERWAILSDAKQAPGQPLRATALHYSTNFGYAMTRPRQSGGPRIAAMERMAYAEGDLPVAAYANRRRALDTVLGDLPLPRMAAVAEGCVETARRLGDQPTLVTIQAIRQFIACLEQPEARPWRLAGPHFDVAAFEAGSLSDAVHAARHVVMLEALLAALFGAWEAGAALHDRTRRYFKAPALQLLPQAWFFATALALYRTGRRPSAWRMAVLRHHARYNPTDHAHRVRLLEAEALRARGRRTPALVAYEAALHAARNSGCALEHGLAAAVAGSGARLLKAEAAARRFEAERDAVWTRLGAVSLLAHPTDATPPMNRGPAATFSEGAVGDQLREMDAARAAAERASRAKSRLLAEVAHELRTPLQGAVGLLGGEASESIDAGALRGVLRHLATVVDDLADMGALEAGGIALANAPFSPARTVEDVRATFMLQAAERRLEVQGEAPPALVGDEVRLRQVLSNLVSNALKHGQGTVTVDLAAMVLDGDADLRIEVWDEGAGLPDAELTRVFEPFQRGPAGQAMEGLGLGLPIARRIARAMGGELRARHRDGRTVFALQVRLPLAAEPAAVAVAADALARPRVLLAEDVALSRRVLARLLEAEGCEVTEAEDGREAFALLTSGSYDLVLTDQRMPGMTGSELCRRARAQGFRGPIAIATGADDPHLRAEVADLDGVVVIRKPLDRDRLRAWLAADPEGPAAPDVVHGRVQELAGALGPEAEAIFRELPGQLDRLLAELSATTRAPATADQIAASAHRLAGFAAHFGLAEVAAQSRRLEGEALTESALTPRTAEAALRAIRSAARNVDWSVYGLGEPAPAD